jgi:8-oxo-dGTP diphosphatase
MFHEKGGFVRIPSAYWIRGRFCEERRPFLGRIEIERKKGRMEVFEVGCAIIHRQGKLLIAQRHLGDSFGGYWEFPGGKREKGETIEGCLEREVFEELAVRIIPERLLCKREHGTIDRRISLNFFFCRWVSGEPRAIDCKDFRWVVRENIREHTFLPGDLEVLEELILRWDEYFKTEKTCR